MARRISYIVVFALLVAAPAEASFFDAYGFGARAMAMGNAHGAASEDYTAAYYNPGALTIRKHPHVGTGVNLLVPALSIDRQPSADPDAPSSLLPSTNVGVNVGVLFPLGGLIENRVALGIAAYLPTIQATRLNAVDFETPHFYRYQSLPDKLIVAGAMAYEFHPTFSAGVGFHGLGRLDGAADVELDLLSRRFIRKDLKVDVSPVTAMTAGLHARPIEGLRIGVSYRGPLAIDYQLTTSVKIKQTGTLVADISGTSVYTPAQITTAVAYDPRDDLTLTVDVVWARWSAAPDPTSHFTVTLDGAPIDKGALVVDSTHVDLGAEDTLSPHLGAEWRPDANWAVRGGYAWYPTPLPKQTGATNYIDSDTHQFALGAGLTFPDPMAIHEAPLTLDLVAQLSVLPSRQVDKSSPDNRVGSYSAGGHIWNIGFEFRHDFY